MKALGCILGVLLLALPGGSQDDRQHRFNYGQMWNTWNNFVRTVYLNGFVDGQSHTFFQMSDDLSEKRREELRKVTFTFYDTDVLRDVISDLYKDPANSFITVNAMIYIARDKLDGKTIDERLRYSRQHDYGIPPK